MVKKFLRKRSKRVSAKTRYKVEKKVREHHRKQRKEAKKNGKKVYHKKQVVHIPDECPFKSDILKEVAETRKQEQEIRKERFDKLIEQRKHAKLQTNNLETIVQSANKAQEKYESSEKKAAASASTSVTQPQSFRREFRAVIEVSDVILEVLDARDPQGTRCPELEREIQAAGKKIVLVLNKADLIPSDALRQWLNFFKRVFPTVAFKSSTQKQRGNLGRGNKGEDKKMTALRRDKPDTESAGGIPLSSGKCLGASTILSLLGNYCRNTGIKKLIHVGVVGLPNVGKSSLINSLKRSKACQVGATPGVTKAMQTVQLDSKIHLVDSPGVVWVDESDEEDVTAALRNALQVERLKDVTAVATAIIDRVGTKELYLRYGTVLPKTGASSGAIMTPAQIFLVALAKKLGKVKKGGVPHTESAARTLLHDWCSGRLKYYTLPPDESKTSEIRSTIVSESAPEFDPFATEEMDTDADQVAILEAGKDMKPSTTFLIESAGCVSKIASCKVTTQKRSAADMDPKLPQGIGLNKKRKMQFRKDQVKNAKERAEMGDLADQLSNVFDAVCDENEDYNFDEMM